MPFRKKNRIYNIQDSEILKYLYSDTGRKGELIAMRFRWILTVLIGALIIHMYINGLKKEALYSIFPFLLFSSYNIFLFFILKHKKVSPWIRYLSTTIDIGVLSLHIFNYARLFNPVSVSTTASLFLYPVLMFMAVLRYDRKLIFYSTALTLLLFNANYFLFHRFVPDDLIKNVVSADIAGQIYKSTYLLFLGYLYAHIPYLLLGILTKQKSILSEKKQTEISLAREQERLLTEKELNESLSKLNFTKDKLFSIIGHDVKNPFAVIHSLSETATNKDNELDKEDIAEIFEKIHTVSGKGLDLLQNLLTWSRVQRNMIKPQPAIFEIYPLVFDVLLLFEEQANQKEITLVNKVKKSHKATIDKEMFHSVLRNIVSNSIKYSESQNSVIVKSTNENNIVSLTIEDKGTGMPSDTLNALLSGQTYQSTPGTRNEKGTGLGMLIVRDFIEAMGGELVIQSEPGKGTIICLSFHPTNAQAP